MHSWRRAPDQSTDLPRPGGAPLPTVTSGAPRAGAPGTGGSGVLEIDGSQLSGSGSVVRQAVPAARRDRQRRLRGPVRRRPGHPVRRSGRRGEFVPGAGVHRARGHRSGLASLFLGVTVQVDAAGNVAVEGGSATASGRRGQGALRVRWWADRTGNPLAATLIQVPPARDRRGSPGERAPAQATRDPDRVCRRPNASATPEKPSSTRADSRRGRECARCDVSPAPWRRGGMTRGSAGAASLVPGRNSAQVAATVRRASRTSPSGG